MNFRFCALKTFNNRFSKIRLVNQESVMNAVMEDTRAVLL